MDTVGGQDAYNQLTAWCYQNLPEDEIAAFNDLVDTGDYGLIEEAIQRLYQHYQEVASQYNYSRNEWDDSQVEYEEDDQDSDVDYSQIQQTVFEAVGGQDVYNAMLTWGEQYLSEDVIDAYDAAIESGDYDQISDAVGWLYEQFIENT
jgi:hypothetical protein